MDCRGPGFLTVVWFGSSPIPSPLSRQWALLATHRKTEKKRQLAGRSLIIRQRESLVLYKTWNTLCCTPYPVARPSEQSIPPPTDVHQRRHTNTAIFWHFKGFLGQPPFVLLSTFHLEEESLCWEVLVRRGKIAISLPSYAPHTCIHATRLLTLSFWELFGSFTNSRESQKNKTRIWDC